MLDVGALVLVFYAIGSFPGWPLVADICQANTIPWLCIFPYSIYLYA